MGLFTALLGIAKLLVLLWLVFVSSFLGTVLVVLPAVPLTVVAPKLGLRICGAAVGSWALLCVWLVEQVGGTRIVLTSDTVAQGATRCENAVLVCNQRSAVRRGVRGVCVRARTRLCKHSR